MLLKSTIEGAYGRKTGLACNFGNADMLRLQQIKCLLQSKGIQVITEIDVQAAAENMRNMAAADMQLVGQIFYPDGLQIMMCTKCQNRRKAILLQSCLSDIEVR